MLTRVWIFLCFARGTEDNAKNNTMQWQDNIRTHKGSSRNPGSCAINIYSFNFQDVMKCPGLNAKV